ncbi:endocuticle structural glycoprotein SgAbd-5-like [Hetaerina americana]|uniref:endocuticle structural glycoprotein SgAbd-5-like n=1 Tax=Hetaerina americana TaxID=62018 RepID=UPI003A7F108A
MKLCAVLLLLAAVALVSARPQQNPNDVVITSYTNENIGVDGYNFGYQLSDGTSRQETGELKNAGTENEAIVVRGSFTYKGADGQEYTVNFVADENGYQPEGAHIPK